MRGKIHRIGPLLHAALLATLLTGVLTALPLRAATVTLDAATIRDKIKGGWVGQTVGCTYGGPTEFRWLGTWIQDYVPLEWDDTKLLWFYQNSPGLYDDLYMDLAFLAVLDKQGLDAPVEAMATKFATAGFALWHANQSARWNILNGVMPPLSGHWKHNPHADDIDFQIEADFIGLISPGMPNTALAYADKVGHIMNYGDGVYGGVFVAAMYSHAYLEQDIASVVEQALLSLPVESKYRQCITDVLAWWRQYPDDWKLTWYEVQKKWAQDLGCPHGALDPFNIDALINGAYIAIGLLYGGGDMGKTIDIATRCGQDSDCNPSNAAGVLGTLLGFSNIPDRWKLGLDKVENLKFSYSDYSLQDVYAVNYRLAAELVKRGGGQVSDASWTIERQEPAPPAAVEVAFAGLTPTEKRNLHGLRVEGEPVKVKFSGRGFVLEGRLEDDRNSARCRLYLDGELVEEVTLKGDYHDRREPLFWHYEFEAGEHELEILRLDGEGVPVLGNLLTYH